MITVTYRIFSNEPLDIEKKAASIALGQTVDTWTPTSRSGISQLKAHRGQVVGVEALSPEPSDHSYDVRIAYPEANTERDIPTLLTMIFGKISMDGRIRVERLDLPKTWTKNAGPRRGIAGIRKAVRVQTRPLQMAIFKPCVGLSPQELGEMFYELASGGMDLIKDDEILPDLSICPTQKRLTACLKAAQKVKKETGRDVLYAVNLTGKPSHLIEKAHRLKKAGANCFLFNVLSYGYGLLEELREVGVPVMAHPTLAGALCGGAETGFSYRVILGTLMRAAGADIVLFPSSYGTVALPHADTMAIKEELLSKQGTLKPAFPVPSAGIHPALVPRIVNDYGTDVIINAGGGVHGHPNGARAGSLAFQQAVAWSLKHKDWNGFSSADGAELNEALKRWGRG